MVQENKLVNRQALLNEQNIKGDKREKRHEDHLLRKLQQETMRESIDSITKTQEKEINREYFEDTLLEKLMQSMINDPQEQSSAIFQRNQGELLMITSAVALTEEEKETIVRKFIKKTKKPLRRITTVVDPSLITGVRLQSESFYYEVSGQKTLRELRRHLERNWHE